MGKCFVCGWPWCLTAKGKLVRHGEGRTCKGSGLSPEDSIKTSKSLLLQEYHHLRGTAKMTDDVRAKLIGRLRARADKLNVEVIWPE